MNGTTRLVLVSPISAGAPPRSAGPAGPVRLTRRGRIVVTAALLAGVLAGGLAFGSDASRATGEAPPPQEHVYVVAQPGQTLWSIARESAPQVDPRVTIGRIIDLNALPGADIQAGQRLALP